MGQYREHLIGLDKPTILLPHLSGTPILMINGQAILHEENRLECISEVLGLVALMTIKGILGPRDAVTVTKAHFQWGRGSSAKSTQAAHCLPGEPRFNEAPFRELKNWSPDVIAKKGIKPLPLSSKLTNLSARTDVVYAVVNETDSLLERMGARGLKPRFAGAIEQLMQMVWQQKPSKTSDLPNLVRRAVEYYRLGAALACEERIDHVRRRKTFSNIEAQRSQEQLAILGRYLELLRSDIFIPSFCRKQSFDELAGDVLL